LPSDTVAKQARPLEGRRALVTAGSNGIGMATASLLHAQGAEVFITGTSDHTAEAAEAVGAAGYALADFTDPSAPAAAVQAAQAALGGIDILVSNTGGPRPAPFAELGDADWLSAYHLILGSAISLTHAVLPGMVHNGGGRVIYLTSTAGIVRPIPRLHLSNVMRAGVAALSSSLVAEYGPHHITFNVIAPGPIDTDRHRGIMSFLADRRGVETEVLEAEEREQIPLRRFGGPDEVASLAAYLASEPAGFITGAVHVIDGGSTVE
jgi:3-oxoacyl-[acyl-carrier protein] reductase